MLASNDAGRDPFVPEHTIRVRVLAKDYSISGAILLCWRTSLRDRQHGAVHETHLRNSHLGARIGGERIGVVARSF